jgi:hypothetical protein
MRFPGVQPGYSQPLQYSHLLGRRDAALDTPVAELRRRIEAALFAGKRWLLPTSGAEKAAAKLELLLPGIKCIEWSRVRILAHIYKPMGLNLKERRILARTCAERNINIRTVTSFPSGIAPRQQR